MSEQDIDPTEPVVVRGWCITRELHQDEPYWSLQTHGVTLHGQEFTARKYYKDIEEVFDFIRGSAL